MEALIRCRFLRNGRKRNTGMIQYHGIRAKPATVPQVAAIAITVDCRRLNFRLNSVLRIIFLTENGQDRTGGESA